MWSLFDAFEAMDLLDTNCVRRKDFMWALKALGNNLEFLRATSRAKLSEHFYATAEDLTVDGFICLCFPAANAEERAQLRRWADMRKAYLLLTRHGFSAQEMELRRIYDFLRKDSSTEHMSLEDMIEAGVLTKEEVDAAEPFDGYPTPLNFARFRRIFSRVLDNKFTKHEDDSPEWRKGVRRKFKEAQLQFRVTCSDGHSHSGESDWGASQRAALATRRLPPMLVTPRAPSTAELCQI